MAKVKHEWYALSTGAVEPEAEAVGDRSLAKKHKTEQNICI